MILLIPRRLPGLQHLLHRPLHGAEIPAAACPRTDHEVSEIEMQGGIAGVEGFAAFEGFEVGDEEDGGAGLGAGFEGGTEGRCC